MASATLTVRCVNCSNNALVCGNTSGKGAGSIDLWYGQVHQATGLAHAVLHETAHTCGWEI